MGIKRGPTPIVTEGLVLYLDAANYRSYPGSGTDWIDLSGYGNHATLANWPIFDSNNQDSFVFDGTDDYFSGTFSCNKTY